MVNKRKPYKTYTREFKIEALRLMEGSGRPPAEIAMELGIRRNQLYKWKEQFDQGVRLLDFGDGTRLTCDHRHDPQTALPCPGAFVCVA